MKKVWLQTNGKRLRPVLRAIIVIINVRSFVLQDTLSKDQNQF